MIRVVPKVYRLFFGVFEPLTTFAGFIYAWFFQEQYFAELIPDASDVLSNTARLLLFQLGNAYLILFVASLFIWFITSDEQVLRALTLALLIGDIGHIYTMAAVQGFDFLISYQTWNALAWGNIGITVS